MITPNVAAWCYLFGVPLFALVACLLCRRHRVLLLLGGLLAVPVGCWVLLLLFPGGADALAYRVCLLLAIPAVAANAILLVGGLVRWGVARRRSTRTSDSVPSSGGD